MNISFRNDISSNCMVIENVKEFSAGDFAVKMITENNIPGLLRFDYEVVNGRADCLYEISSQLFFAKAFEYTKIGFEDIKTLLYSMNLLLKNLNACLLDPDNVILKKECIFLDKQKKRYSFCYFPYYGGNFVLETRELFAELLSILDYNDRKAVRLAYDLQKASVSETFTFEDAMRIMETVSVDREICQDAAAEKAASYMAETPPVFLSETPESGQPEEDSFFKKAGQYFRQTSPQDIFDDFNELKIVNKIRNYRGEHDRNAENRPAGRQKEALEKPVEYAGIEPGNEDLPIGILQMQKRLQESE